MAKIKGKEWYQIKASKLFDEKIIGETLTMNPENLFGKVITSSLMDFGGKVDKYYVKLFFKIKKMEEGILETDFHGHECTRDFTARIVRKGSQRLDTNDIFQFKNGKMRIKTIAVCNGRVSLSVATSLRKKILELLKEQTKDSTIETFVKGFISNSIQRSIREKLNKIYPVRVFEIRKTKVI